MYVSGYAIVIDYSGWINELMSLSHIIPSGLWVKLWLSQYSSSSIETNIGKGLHHSLCPSQSIQFRWSFLCVAIGTQTQLSSLVKGFLIAQRREKKKKQKNKKKTFFCHFSPFFLFKWKSNNLIRPFLHLDLFSSLTTSF